ncbi:MAG TPA: hypothetical protein VL738_07365 [Dactylosporangium sp.]|nr:hypothetical protein [Dactylosporangium sp.]
MDDRVTALRNRLARLSGAARIHTLLELGQTLADRYWRTGPGRPAGLPDLEGAIAACREAHGLIDPAAAVRGNVAANTGWLLGVRHTVHGGPVADREDGIALLEEALACAGLAPMLGAMARVVAAQLYLGRVIEEMGSFDATRLMSGGATTTVADADRAAARLREVLAGPAMNAEITAAAEAMLPLAEALRDMLEGFGGGGGLASFDLSRMMKAMAAAEQLRQSMGTMPRPASSMASPAPFLSDALAAADPLDYPVAVVRDTSARTATATATATVPRPRAAPPPPPSDAARAAVRRRLSSLAGTAEGEPWDHALTLLFADAAALPRKDVDALVGGASNAADLAEPDDAGVDHLLLAVALCLRHDDDDRGAAVRHLVRAVELIPDRHQAAGAAVEAFGAFVDPERPFAGPIGDLATLPLGKRGGTSAVDVLCRAHAAIRSGAPVDPESLMGALDALPDGHRLRPALVRAIGQVRLAAAVHSGDPDRIRAAATEAPSPFADAVVAVTGDDLDALRAAGERIAAGPGAGGPALAAVVGAVRLYDEDDAGLKGAIEALESAAAGLDDMRSGLRTRTWRRLAAAYRRRGAAGDAERARAAAVAALDGADQDPVWAARFAGWMLADGRAEDAFRALEIAASPGVAAGARPETAWLAGDLVEAMLGVGAAGVPAPETPEAQDVAAALRAMGAAALVYLHPTDEAGRTVGVLCLDAATEQLDVAANVPVTDPLTSGDPTWPAIVERWRDGGGGVRRRARILVAAADGPAGIPLAAARTVSGKRVAEEFDVSRVAGGAEAVRLAGLEVRAIAVEPVFVINPRGDREADMIDVLVLRRLFYPRSVCLGRALEPVDGAGEPAELLDRLPGASLLHLACGVRVEDGAAVLELAGGRVLAAADIAAAGGLAILPAAGHAAFTALADALLGAGCTGVAGWQRGVPSPVAALAQFMLHLALVEGAVPAIAVGAVQRWMINPDRTVPPDVPTPLAGVARAVDLTEPALWASLTYRGR